MIANITQRWKSGRVSYRPAGEVANPLEYEVREVTEEERVRPFVEREHYAHSFPAARYKFEFWRRPPGKEWGLVGAAVFSHPTNDLAITNVLPGKAVESVELGRFILLADVPANGESMLLAPCLQSLRRLGLMGVISFSDPIPRRAANRLVMPGHIGTIYQASNALYIGRSTPKTLHLFSDGTEFSARAMQKIRKKEVGWRYAVEQLLQRGADGPPTTGDLTPWLATWVARLTTKVRHGGNLKYVFPLGGKAVERHIRRVAMVRRYPKAERSADGALVRIIEA